MARSRYKRDGRGSSSSSESSLSSESEVGSDASSDGIELGLSGKGEAEQKFKRLRRIFLNRPTKAKKRESNQQRQRSPSSRRPGLERRSSKASVTERPHSLQRRRASISSNSSSTSYERTLEGPSKPANSVRPLQAAIDQHMHSLWEQMKRHSAQRDSTANQVQSMLEQAVDELQFLKKQEERALESQVRLIRESYALRLEVFQQQYLSKVAEIEDEMYASIQKRQQECDVTVLAAAKKLQDQTQHALLKDLARMNSEPMEEQLDSSSFSTASSSSSQSKVHRHRSVRPLRHEPLSSPHNPSRVEPLMKQASPVSKQRAKLQALEEKLAAFSPESLTRVKNELATPARRSNAERTAVKPKRKSIPRRRHSLRKNESQDAFARDANEWQVSPLSPLRKGPSYWKNGISLEARSGREVGNAGNSGKSDRVEERAASVTEKRRAPASLLSRRFLRPEEEEELRHLQTSIGLAKDWMAKNS